MRNNDVKTGNNGLIEPECCSIAALARLVDSVNRFNAFACMFNQFCCTHDLVSGYLLQLAALWQACKSTWIGRAHGAILGTRCYPQCTPRARRVSVSVSTPIASLLRPILRGRGNLAWSNRATTVTHPRSFPCCRRCAGAASSSSPSKERTFAIQRVLS